MSQISKVDRKVHCFALYTALASSGHFHFPNLTIMRSNTFNRTFGGVAAVAWDSEGLWVEDPDAYLFSIDDQTKFYQEDPSRPAVYHDAQDGPSLWLNEFFVLIGI
jgi:hypothetical protein